jgi:hypothetical protein
MGAFEITQALIARNGYHASSISEASQDEADNAPQSLLDTLGAEEPEYRTVEDCLAVKPLIAALPEQDRQVLIMRFYESQTPSPDRRVPRRLPDAGLAHPGKNAELIARAGITRLIAPHPPLC